MNQDIKPGTALLIIFIFGGILFAKFWALSSSYGVQVFSYMPITRMVTVISW